MGTYIEKPRYVCALGAYETALAIDRVVPILHAGPGCGAKLDGGLGTYNGCQGAGYVSPHLLPCTNITEKEIIFGGNEKLYQEIENALKIYDADLFAVFSGCTSEIVGDDIAEVVSRFSGSDKPVIHVQSAGFKGSNLTGHELFFDAVIEQYLKPSAHINPKQVNVWSSVPFFHPFWYGDLKEIESLLKEIGLEANILFGPNGGTAALKKIPQAAFNLVLSPWVGLSIARKLNDEFGTPFLHYPVLPVGPSETAKFLHAVAYFAGIPSPAVNRVTEKHEREYYYLIERASDELVKTRLLPSRFITVADSLYALGITKFLVNDMGLLPQIQFVTDNPPEEYHDSISREFNLLEGGIRAVVEFTGSSGLAQERIATYDFKDKAFILGSGWEKSFSKNTGTLTLPVAAPLLERMVLNRTYVGYRGALTLLEDICTVLLGSYQ